MLRKGERILNILQINYSDLKGRIYNGYDLHLSLNQSGIKSKQLVADKLSNDESVVCVKKNFISHSKMKYVEEKFSIRDILYPYGLEISDMDCYAASDIVHYHLLYNNFISLLDLPMLMNKKTSVWTIHDPWIVTGNCIYPLECSRWKIGCGKCKNLDNMGHRFLEMHEDNTEQMWQLKKYILSRINPTIVISSEFMRNYITKSPLTRHFTDIVKIPFGIKLTQNKEQNRSKMRKRFALTDETFLIGFRSEANDIKGCSLLYEALKYISKKEKVTLITVGSGAIPEYIKEKYKIIELGWVNDEKIMKQFFCSCDLFVMPSLAESFGLMAIEAMSAGVPVVCFQGTVVEELIQAPRCGLAVEYKSIGGLTQALEYMMQNKDIAIRKGEAGRELVSREYTYEKYVDRHIQLYERLYKT